jgi:hypothetical protein
MGAGMRNGLLAAVAAAALCAAGVGGAFGQSSNDGQNRWMTVRNASQLTAYQIYVIPSKQDCCWSRDLLEDQTIPPTGNPRSSLNVNFDNGRGACLVDVRITTDAIFQGWDWYFDSVDVCSPPGGKRVITLEGKFPKKNGVITIDNRSQYTAYQIYMMPSDRDCCWSPDLLGFGVIPTNSSLPVRFDDGNNGCVFDIRVTTHAQGKDWYLDKVNVCKVTNIILKGDKDDKNRWMTVKNQSLHDALSVYMIPSSKDCCWSRDLLGKEEIIEKGASKDVDFDDRSGECTFDIRVTRRDSGRDWLFDKVNVCEVPEITLK